MTAWKKYFLIAASAAVSATSTSAKLMQLPLPQIATIQALASDQFMLSGEVTARTDIDFTLLVRNSELLTVQVTKDTAILRGAESIKLSDLRPGTKVVVTTMRGGEGQLLAVNVTVKDRATE